MYLLYGLVDKHHRKHKMERFIVQVIPSIHSLLEAC